MRQAAGAALAAMLIGGGLSPALAADEATGPVIFDMDTMRFKQDEKNPSGTIQQVEGKFGKALRFDFNEIKDGTSKFFMGYTKTPPEADQCQGLSFWLKGDGSDNFACLELIDESNYGLRYDYAFPIKPTEWTKITVPWRDFLPILAGPLIDGKDGFKPSRFGAYWLGKFYYWPSKPAIGFALDQIALEKTIAVDTTDYTPAGDPLARLRAKLQAKKPITFVSMGDSLTDKKHNSNANAKTWAEQLAAKIKEKYGSEVTYVNPALGGRGLTQCAVLMPLWVKDAPQPDLVTVFFGGNDYDNFVAQKVGEEDMGKQFAAYQAATVDRIRRLTKGSADVMLMTTAPGFKRWDTYKPLVDATKAVAKEKKAALADVDAAFHAAGTAEVAVKAGYWHWDNVHMGPKGHEVICETVLKAIEGK